MQNIRRVVEIDNEVRIYHFGDLQMEEIGFKRSLWRKFLNDVNNDPNALVLGQGDYTDKFRTSVDKKIRKICAEDNSLYSQFDAVAMREMQEFSEDLKPFANRIIGLHEGHHFHQMNDGKSTTKYLCELLKVPFLDFTACIQLIVRSKGNLSAEVNIYSTHGCTGGTTVGIDLATIERKYVPYWNADLYVFGHSNKLYAVQTLPLNTFSHNTNDKNSTLHIHRKPRWIVRTGSFMDSHIDGAPANYVERGGMAPLNLGWAVTTISFVASHNVGQGRLKIESRAVFE